MEDVMNEGDSLRTKLSREVCLGATLLVPSPHLVEMLGGARFDCVMIDQEHAAASIETVEHLLRSADAVRLPALVRVPQATPQAMMAVLDLGACGVVVPHIDSAEAAIAAVQATRFPPRGRRGVCPSIRATRYGAIRWSDYAGTVERDTMVIPIVESPEAVSRIDEILAVPGVSALLLGPVDLAAALGVPGQTDHRDVSEALRIVVKSARAHDVPAAMVIYDWRDLGNLDSWILDGVRLFLLSMTGSISRMLQEARLLVAPRQR
jgi:2-keto-3-deoxy-L-rhamnonate aldolase RhmA